MAPAMSTFSDEGSHPRERPHGHETNDEAVPSSPLLESRSASPVGLRARLGLSGVARRTVGFALLLLTVFLWTMYNFIASVRILEQLALVSILMRRSSICSLTRRITNPSSSSISTHPYSQSP